MRDLYKCVDYKILGTDMLEVCAEHVTPRRIVEAAGELKGAEGLSEQDVIIDLQTIHYGLEERNPLDAVRFYSKRSLNRKCSRWSPGSGP